MQTNVKNGLIFFVLVQLKSKYVYPSIRSNAKSHSLGKSGFQFSQLVRLAFSSKSNFAWG
ncbi:hypothetical protein Lwal_2726 [Legionella waltersii]|uniref:Uncharacterized protein n=1 Tax=Legionella waltersii TaxID=66969 RepID=A0A0W1A012_9GAMM|nr:hypothetical protein Lwal_2726 [Legionella waltersii]SNV09215.1 Uncharacterised protein [Legionella waltersii]